MTTHRGSLVERTKYLVPKGLEGRVHHSTNYLETVIHVVKGNLGAGLFAMGDAMKNGGLALAPPGIFFLGCICIYNQHLLVRVTKAVTEIKAMEKDLTFPEAISLAFECGPPSFARLSNFVKGTVTTFIMITQFGFCVIYVTIVSTSLKTLVEGTDDRLSVRLYLLFTLPPVFVASLISTLKLLAPVSALSLVLLLYGCGVQEVLSVLHLMEGPLAETELLAPPRQWPLFVGTVIFTFEGIALVLPLRGEMREPERFDQTLGPLNVGVFFCVALYLSLGPLTYLQYGLEVESPCTINLSSDPLSESVRVAVALGILLTYPIQFYVPVKQVMAEVARRKGPLSKPLLLELGIRGLLVLATYAVALVVPYVSLVVSLLGAVCSNQLALLFPALASLSLRFGPEPSSTSGCRLVMDVISLALSILGTGFGLYVSVWDLYLAISRDLQKGGMGFSTQ